MTSLRSRIAVAMAIGGFVALLAACGSPPPPERLLRMPLASENAGAAPSATVSTAPAGGEPWQLVLPVGLPAYLDTAALLVPAGRSGAGLEPLPGVRWAEPLRDAVPRLLRHDLARLRGESLVWTAPLPASTPAARLRVELVAFETEPDGAAVRLVARWSLQRADGSAATVSGADLRVPVATTAAIDATAARADALVLAHRQALRALAERIAATR